MPDRVVVAMSGGVDSSVAAALLKEKGFDVIGIGLSLVEPGENAGERSCCGIASMDDARRVAEKLSIPFYVLNFRDDFRSSVIEYFTTSYVRGETPNPCVPCNGIIKFDGLMRVALGLEATCLATGHYARVAFDEGSGRYVLRTGLDDSKDQSYFLHSLTQYQLSRAMFPVGELDKNDTRREARRFGLKVSDKPESQDTCFIGAEGCGAFVTAFTSQGSESGAILDESGGVIGTHRGLPYYTVGQRHGLGISHAEPVYVVDIDPDSNSITVAPRARLFRESEVLVDDVNYISIEPPSGPLEVSVKTRYGKPAQQASFLPTGAHGATVRFDSPQEPTAPGQSVVSYVGDTVVAGGIARRKGRL
ncbi:MAG TPA: tRNA 2-thiouridine(34) synthase MnmA [Candidatus Anoxymicrobiaceae bacterium]